METSFTFSQSGQRPDRSLFAYTYSASLFQPSPSDLALDAALQRFADLGLEPNAPKTRSSRQSTDGWDAGSPAGPRSSCGFAPSHAPRSQHSRHDSYYYYADADGRVRDPPYPGSYYVGSSAPARREERKAIEYPGPPPRQSDVGSRGSRRSRRAVDVGGGGGAESSYSRPPPFEGLRYVDELYDGKARVRYGGGGGGAGGGRKGREWDDDLYLDGMSVGPEDSISQVSSVPRSERRGRTRRREGEGSVYSSSTVKASRYGRARGYDEPRLYCVDESDEPEYYMTRDITPTW